MSLWLVRAGRHGEHEQRFLDENRIYLTWGGFDKDLNQCKAKSELRSLLEKIYPNASAARISSSLGQIWAFYKMKEGDWIILPSKHAPALHVGEIVGPYIFDRDAKEPYHHYRTVKWIEQDIPRSNFDQDILYSLGAIMTICQIKRHDAEARIRAMAETGWKPTGSPMQAPITAEAPESGEFSDLAEIARDQIAKMIIRQFKGHGMTRLVNAILQAQGYTTYMSPEGPDKGVDILAAPPPMGFGEPKICVQVKSSEAPLDRPTLDQLIGTMQNVHAQNGLLVSWGGFKTSIDREKATQFFRVRLWNQSDLINNLLDNYDKLDEVIRTELPLKRIWAPTITEHEED
jgi:restriction system protein